MFLFRVYSPASALDEEVGSGAIMVQEVDSLFHGLPLLLPCAVLPTDIPPAQLYAMSSSTP